MSYIKETFDPVSFDHAKHIVLTSDPNNPNKFEEETASLVDTLAKEITISENSNVLDFGCGMGRVSKELITRFNCNVTGVDISERMKTFAMLYISNPKKFKTVEVIEQNVFDVCISAFVLQHTENPQKEIQRIFNALKEDGIFVLLNENVRLVPSGIDRQNYVIWNDDKFDVHAETEKHFKLIKSVPYEPNTQLNIIFYKKNV